MLGIIWPRARPVSLDSGGGVPSWGAWLLSSKTSVQQCPLIAPPPTALPTLAHHRLPPHPTKMIVPAHHPPCPPALTPGPTTCPALQVHSTQAAGGAEAAGGTLSGSGKWARIPDQAELSECVRGVAPVIQAVLLAS